MLTTGSILSLGTSEQQVRLSCVLDDFGGCKKGLTVARFLPGSLESLDGSQIGIDRWPVYSGSDKVGVTDPVFREWDAVVDQTAGLATEVVTSGAMTCTFTIPENVQIHDDLGPARVNRIAERREFSDKVVSLLGGGQVGIIRGELSHLDWRGKVVYPVLYLERSTQDASSPPGIRNGAMVVTSDGALVGIIVAVIGAGAGYAVAPIQDVMDWHRLQFAPPLGRSPVIAETQAPSTLVPWRPPDRASARLKSLVNT